MKKPQRGGRGFFWSFLPVEELEYAEQLARIEPTNAEIATLVETLRRQTRGGGNEAQH